MTKKGSRMLTLSQPAAYTIKVSGVLDQNWLDWDEGMKVTVGSDRSGEPVITLTTTIDQAGLQGLLRHLYSLGLPLISVVWEGV